MSLVARRQPFRKQRGASLRPGRRGESFNDTVSFAALSRRDANFNLSAASRQGVAGVVETNSEEHASLEGDLFLNDGIGRGNLRDAIRQIPLAGVQQGLLGGPGANGVRASCRNRKRKTTLRIGYTLLPQEAWDTCIGWLHEHTDVGRRMNLV